MEQLRAYLKTHMISQTAFAQRVGMSKSYLSQFLSGDRRPGLDLALRIERETEGVVPPSAWAQEEGAEP